MIITKVEKQAKRARYNIYLDDVYGFSVSEKVFFDSGLVKGQELSETEISSLKKNDEESKAYNRAVLILSYRANTEHELKTKLLKNFEEVEVSKVIAKLKEQSFLDDEDFAKRYTAQSKKGKKLVKLELIKKGISKELAEKSAEIKDEELELENAVKFAEKIIKKYKKESSQIIKQKLYEGLTRKGFSYDVFKVVFRNLKDIL